MGYSIALSLGHNSSAILLYDGKILAGYETERFDEIKSSSAFPLEPIYRLMMDFGITPDEIDVYVGHWFTSGNLPEESTKHCNLEALKQFKSVSTLSQDLTHHDSHLESAMVFAKDLPNYTAFVMDGFGTMGECISIYSVDPTGYKILKRVFGYENSLGLLYQYATDFMGMKMNNHEYKILAYEVHINDLDIDKNILDEVATTYSRTMLDRIFSGDFKKDYDPVVNVSALMDVKSMIHLFLQESLEAVGVSYEDLDDRRVVTAYLVQSIVENVVLSLRNIYQSANLVLVGGLFYNVKLNSLLADRTPGKLCVFPLAGDQGAGLGVYQAHCGDLKWPDHVFWGRRNLSGIKSGNGIEIFDSYEDAYPLLVSEIERIGFVNLVRGSMEFGPRALCHTSTLAKPIQSVTQMINFANSRTAEMPMAPVVTYDQAKALFLDVDKIHKSLEYMVVTRVFKENDVAVQFSGAAHYYPDQDHFTARPQITNDPLIVALLQKFGPLVNTSLNFHGVPIVFEEESIIATHEAQRATQPDLDITTVIIRNQKP